MHAPQVNICRKLCRHLAVPAAILSFIVLNLCPQLSCQVSTVYSSLEILQIYKCSNEKILSVTWLRCTLYTAHPALGVITISGVKTRVQLQPKVRSVNLASVLIYSFTERGKNYWSSRQPLAKACSVLQMLLLL